MRYRRQLQSVSAPRLQRLCCAVAMLSAALAGSAAHAASVVTLRNGFTITCASHGQIAPDTLRLYLNAASGAESYMDVPVASVASIEAAPDVPSTLAHPTAAPSAVAQPALHTLLQQSGLAHNVSAALLASVVAAESAGNAAAVSRTGARGLMQLMPGTAKELGVRDSFAPAENVEGGSAYLDRLLTRYHDNVALALAAYNAGPAAVDRYRGIPPYRETRQYVARVLREFNRLARAEAMRANTAEAAVLSGLSR